MKEKFKIIFRGIIFFIIGLFILYFLEKIFVPKWIDPIDPATARLKGFYLEDKNTIDVVIIGTSGVSRGFSPIKVWNEYGITSYNFGSSYQTMPIAYYKLCEFLKYQNPKVVILDMDAVYRWKDKTEEAERKLFDNLKLDDVKINAINDEKVGLKDKFSFFFPIVRYHSRWSELEKADFSPNKKEEYQNISYKGMPMITTIKPYVDTVEYMKDKGKTEKILDDDIEYIDKIVNVCKEKNIKILWTNIPCAHSWSLAYSNAVSELAKKYNIEYIDYNLKSKSEEIGLNWNKDTYDKGGHMNLYGAEKVSNNLGKVLFEKYKCTSKKDNKKIAKKWNKVAKKYKENKEKLEKNKK